MNYRVFGKTGFKASEVSSVDADIAAEHEGISAAMQFQIFDIQIPATPKHFIGIVYLHVLDFDIVHLAEHLGYERQ